MSLKERINGLLKERKMSARSLETELGLGGGYISKMDKSEPSAKTVRRIADYFGVSTDYLLYGDENIATDENAGKIPVLGVVRAGELLSQYEAALDYIASDYDPAEYFALMVKGDSMTPRLFEGDLVIVRKQDTVENGDYAVVQVNGDEAVVKKVLVFAHGLGLQSLNPNYPLVQFNETEIAEKPVRVLGKVVEMRGRM